MRYRNRLSLPNRLRLRVRLGQALTIRWRSSIGFRHATALVGNYRRRLTAEVTSRAHMGPKSAFLAAAVLP
jgi:hypothetical protein